jgi:hypothetical protein
MHLRARGDGLPTCRGYWSWERSRFYPLRSQDAPVRDAVQSIDDNRALYLARYVAGPPAAVR